MSVTFWSARRICSSKLPDTIVPLRVDRRLTRHEDKAVGFDGSRERQVASDVGGDLEPPAVGVELGGVGALRELVGHADLAMSASNQSFRIL